MFIELSDATACSGPMIGATQTLLLIAYYFPPANTSGAQRPFRFVKYLQNYNFRTHVITASPQTEAGRWKDVIETPNGAMPNGMGSRCVLPWRALQRVLPYNDELPWVGYAIKSAERLLQTVRPVAILSTSPPVACHLAALSLHRRFGISWIADFRDPFYANPLRPKKLARPYQAIVERLILQNADAIVANTDSAAETLRRRYTRFGHKIHIIWNGYDPQETFQASAVVKHDHKVLLHAGSLYAGRHPGAVLSSIQRLIDRGRLDPALTRLRFIGWLESTSEPWTMLPAFSSLRQIGCLECATEPIPQPEAIREMAQADYLLLLDLNDTGSATQVPAKLFQYIRIGRPILAFTPANSPSERILAQSGIPHVIVHPDAPEEQIDHRVAALLDMPSEPSRPSRWFEEQFNAEAQTKKLAEILRGVTRSSVECASR